MMEKEQRYVVDAFQRNESAFCGKSILLYGVGKNTQAILEGVHGFSIVGLMDEKLSGQEKFGLRVLSEEEAVDGYDDDRIIVIVARDSVVSIIYKRIEHLHKECGIRIYDYKGTDLTEAGSDFIPKDMLYWKDSKETLYRAIDAHDIISFDIFDTLLMRRVLEPKDVFRVVEMRLKRMGISIPFFKIRVESEESLAATYPSLDDIYSEMCRRLPEYQEQLSDVRRIEEETDREQFVVREVLRDAMKYAVKKRKRVYLLSDMYYSSKYLDEILRENGISGHEKIFVSNEMKATKEDGEAYRRYKSEVYQGGEFRILHIGDNRYADEQMAEQNGIDTFLVYSGYELLMASSMQSLLVNMKGFGRRCIMGLVIARMFRDPFCLGKTRGEVNIDVIEDLGYCFVAPMLTEYVKWLDRAVVERKVKQLIFTARDGYLIKKLYELMLDVKMKTINDGRVQRTEDNENTDLRCFYVRTSRRSATVSGIRDDEDIARISERRFNGTIGELMKRRFGVDITGDKRGSIHVSQDDGLALEGVISDYHGEILSESEKERGEYLEYLRKQGVDFASLEDSLVFDFVSSGTVWYNLSRMFEKNVNGACFATMNLPNAMYEEDSDRIVSAYGNIQSYGSDTALARHYLVLESILTDKKDSFVCIRDGKGIYEGDGINHKYEEIKPIHDEAIRYAEEYFSLYGDVEDDIPVDLEFVDELFGELFAESNCVSEEIKTVFVNDDVYDGIEKSEVWK